MKRLIAVVVTTFVVLLSFMSCASNHDVTVSEVGWSHYTDIVAKDFDAIGVVSVEFVEVHTKSPFFFVSTKEGSRATYAELMKKAVEMGGNDIINVRIDKNQNSATKGIFDFFTGSKNTITYTATATVIKYKDAHPVLMYKDGQPTAIAGSGRTGDLKVSSEKGFFHFLK